MITKFGLAGLFCKTVAISLSQKGYVSLQGIDVYLAKPYPSPTTGLQNAAHQHNADPAALSFLHPFTHLNPSL